MWESSHTYMDHTLYGLMKLAVSKAPCHTQKIQQIHTHMHTYTHVYLCVCYRETHKLASIAQSFVWLPRTEGIYLYPSCIQTPHFIYRTKVLH